MAKAKPIQVVVITPERQVLEAGTDSVVIPAHDGELGVLENRAPLMCELATGTLRYKEDGKTRKVAIDGGFAQVFNNRVIVLTEQATTASEVTPELIASVEKTADDQKASPTARVRAKRRASALRGLQIA
ncbi:MAG: ATP synthase F1 subunit epsilon [Phycisphaerae bacterium]